MHAASRDALNQLTPKLDNLTAGAAQAPTAAQLGAELFDVVEALDKDRALRIAVADTTRTAEQRAGLIREVFNGRVAQPTLEILGEAAAQSWSTPREFRTGLVVLGRRALLRGAESEGQLQDVEDQLYDLSRILDREPELSMLLSDPRADAAQKRSLLASVLYGKALKYTEALALQVIGRPEHNPVDDIAALVDQAADLRGRTVAQVVSAAELTDAQRQVLAEKLGQLYGRDFSIHTVVDESILGGMIIRVGDEKIDGSTIGRLERLRAQLV